jgi:hypothetical protein
MRAFKRETWRQASGRSPARSRRAFVWRGRDEIESGCLDEMLFDGLALIKERDGDQILDEVSRDLLIEALTSIEYLRGSLPNSWRGLLQALCVERQADEAKIDAWVLQQRRDDGSTALVA